MSEYLSVVPEFLEKLAVMQNDVAADVGSAISLVDGISESVATTHGSYCSQFNTTLTELVTVRGAAGTALQTVVTELADNLAGAASTYLGADESAASVLNKMVR
jgi:hypothetical protein